MMCLFSCRLRYAVNQLKWWPKFETSAADTPSSSLFSSCWWEWLHPARCRAGCCQFWTCSQRISIDTAARLADRKQIYSAWGIQSLTHTNFWLGIWTKIVGNSVCRPRKLKTIDLLQLLGYWGSIMRISVGDSWKCWLTDKRNTQCEGSFNHLSAHA